MNRIIQKTNIIKEPILSFRKFQLQVVLILFLLQMLSKFLPRGLKYRGGIRRGQPYQRGEGAS